MLSGAAAVDVSACGLRVRGAAFRPGRSRLLTGPEGTTWVFDNDGARVGGTAGGRHRLTQFGAPWQTSLTRSSSTSPALCTGRC